MTAGCIGSELTRLAGWLVSNPWLELLLAAELLG